MGCIWLSRNSDTFSVGAPQFEMTGLPGTFDSRLWILGRMYIYVRQNMYIYVYVHICITYIYIIYICTFMYLYKYYIYLRILNYITLQLCLFFSLKMQLYINLTTRHLKILLYFIFLQIYYTHKISIYIYT